MGEDANVAVLGRKRLDVAEAFQVASDPAEISVSSDEHDPVFSAGRRDKYVAHE
jgi:hypothetical protein